MKKLSNKTKNILYLVYLLFFIIIGILAAIFLNWLFIIAVIGNIPALIITIKDLRKGEF